MRTLLEEGKDLLDVCENRLTEPVAATEKITANAADTTAKAATHLARFKNFSQSTHVKSIFLYLIYIVLNKSNT